MKQSGKSERRNVDVVVYGPVVDDETRCVHYQGPDDVIALKFVCCDRYFPCHLCHEALADHPARPWPAADFDQPAVLCGVCRGELTVSTYLISTACPTCGARFNERCAAHHPLYFELSDHPHAEDQTTTPGL